jgi:hypothetical protein
MGLDNGGLYSGDEKRTLVVVADAGAGRRSASVSRAAHSQNELHAEQHRAQKGGEGGELRCEGRGRR